MVFSIQEKSQFVEFSMSRRLLFPRPVQVATNSVCSLLVVLIVGKIHKLVGLLVGLLVGWFVGWLVG